MSQAETTIDHAEIRSWAEERNGRPARVKSTAGQDEGILRFDFQEPDESLEVISWDEFFRIFESNGLALLRQEEMSRGQTSRFFKFVKRQED